MDRARDTSKPFDEQRRLSPLPVQTLENHLLFRDVRYKTKLDTIFIRDNNWHERADRELSGREIWNETRWEFDAGSLGFFNLYNCVCIYIYIYIHREKGRKKVFVYDTGNTCIRSTSEEATEIITFRSRWFLTLWLLGTCCFLMLVMDGEIFNRSFPARRVHAVDPRAANLGKRPR